MSLHPRQRQRIRYQPGDLEAFCTSCSKNKPVGDFIFRAENGNKRPKLCKECHRSNTADWVKNNPERRKEIANKWARANTESRRDWKRNNKEAAKKWDKENPERVKEMKEKWRRRNAHKVLSYRRIRQAEKLKAMPKWADKKAIAAIYKEANRLDMEVDHIIPLRNKYVCGLHCEANLRIITMSENRKKANKLLPEFVSVLT